MSTAFVHASRHRVQHLSTALCVGLDPRLEWHPDLADLRRHTLQTLAATADQAAVCKPQLAFYEALGLAGMRLLDDIREAAKELGLPLLLDAKRGDIGSTASAYAKAWLSGDWAGAAITVNPFLGFETVLPFLEVAAENGGAVYVLVKTSNPGQNDLQGGGISEKVAEQVERWAAEYTSEGTSILGAVVGATHAADLQRFREMMPSVSLLLPGLGAQGAQAADLAPAFLSDGTGAFVNASRGVQYPSGVPASADEARAAAEHFRLQLRAAAGI